MINQLEYKSFQNHRTKTLKIIRIKKPQYSSSDHHQTRNTARHSDLPILAIDIASPRPFRSGMINRETARRSFQKWKPNPSGSLQKPRHPSLPVATQTCKNACETVSTVRAIAASAAVPPSPPPTCGWPKRRPHG